MLFLLKSSFQGVDLTGMSHSSETKEKTEYLSQISNFVARSSGLRSRMVENNCLYISQSTDGKAIPISVSDLEEVIPRIDSDGHSFLQVNFHSGKKILLTQNLIGFKPAPARGLDLGKLPRVVTTPDILSVVEAIEDTVCTPSTEPNELEILKKVFDSVLRGAEAVGFDTTPERLWMQQLNRQTKATA
jgi:hypothetical protein